MIYEIKEAGKDGYVIGDHCEELVNSFLVLNPSNPPYSH